MSIQTYVAQHHESQKVAQNVCYSGASALAGIFMTGARWLVGADVKIRSSIWVGAYVKQPFVVLARVLLLLALYYVYDPTAPDRLMMSITAWADPVIASMDVRNNVPGAATMMKYKDFVLHFATSLYMVFTHAAAIVNALSTGITEQAVLSVAENLLMMPYSWATSYDHFTQLGLASISAATIVYTLTCIEYYTVGMLAKFLEYMWFDKHEHVKDEYKEIVLQVLGQKLPLATACWWQQSPANLLFEKAVKTHGSPTHIAALLRDSPLEQRCQGKWKSGKACTHKAKYGHFCGHHKKIN